MKSAGIVAGVALALGMGGAAMAADLGPAAPMAPVVAAAAPYNWTGFYVGVHGGYGWGNVDSTSLYWSGGVIPVPPPNHDSFDDDGGILGGQVGYNYQLRNDVVLGIEGALSWMDMKGQFTFGPGAGGPGTAGGSADMAATVRGRIGYAFGRFLPYVAGGLAYEHTKSFIDIPGTTNARDNADAWGWTIGAGVEYALTNHISLRAEYLHEDFGAAKTRLAYPGGSYLAVSAKSTQDIGLVGINYRF